MDNRCWATTERREIAPNKTKLVPQNLLKLLVAPIFLTSTSGSPITFKGHFCAPISPTEVSLFSGRAKQHFFTLASSVSVDRVAPIRGSTSQVGAADPQDTVGGDGGNIPEERRRVKLTSCHRWIYHIFGSCAQGDLVGF